jgi:hypothetical protein
MRPRRATVNPHISQGIAALGESEERKRELDRMAAMLSRLGGRGYCVKEDPVSYRHEEIDPESGKMKWAGQRRQTDQGALHQGTARARLAGGAAAERRLKGAAHRRSRRIERDARGPCGLRVGNREHLVEPSRAEQAVPDDEGDGDHATIGSFLVVPSNRLKVYLTDRIGNIGKLEPDFPLWRDLTGIDGALQIIVVEQDAESFDVPKIPKGDGRARVAVVASRTRPRVRRSPRSARPGHRLSLAQENDELVPHCVRHPLN